MGDHSQDSKVLISNGVIRLALPNIRAVEEQNIARKHMGLSPIKIVVRKCLACGQRFESTGNRNCGCSRGRGSTVLGHEAII